MVPALLFLILSLLAFSSVVLGTLLSYYVKEELTPGAKYFKFFQDSLIFIIIVLFLYFNPLIIFFILAILLFFGLRFLGKYEHSFYFGLFVLLFASYLYKGFTFIWTLIFLYGFFQSSYFCSKNQKLSLKKSIVALIKNNWGFILGSLVGSLVLLFL